MAKSKYGHITKVDIYRKSIPTSELKAIRRQYAKQLNQRLVRLERAKSDISGKSFAESGAGEMIKAKLEELGRNRFSELLSPKTSEGNLYNRRDIQREIIELKTLLDYKTSTVAGAKKSEAKRVQTFEEQYGITAARSKEFYDFLKSDSYKALTKTTLTSEQIQDFYQKEYSAGISPDKIQQMFDEYLEQVEKSPTGEVTYKGLKNALGKATSKGLK